MTGLFFHILGMSSSQLTNLFFRGVETTNQYNVGITILNHPPVITRSIVGLYKPFRLNGWFMRLLYPHQKITMFLMGKHPLFRLGHGFKSYWIIVPNILVNIPKKSMEHHQLIYGVVDPQHYVTLGQHLHKTYGTSTILSGLTSYKLAFSIAMLKLPQGSRDNQAQWPSSEVNIPPKPRKISILSGIAELATLR